MYITTHSSKIMKVGGCKGVILSWRMETTQLIISHLWKVLKVKFSKKPNLRQRLAFRNLFSECSLGLCYCGKDMKPDWAEQEVGLWCNYIARVPDDPTEYYEVTIVLLLFQKLAKGVKPLYPYFIRCSLPKKLVRSWVKQLSSVKGN